MMRRTLLILSLCFLVASSLGASELVTTVEDTFIFTNVDSNEGLGDGANVIETALVTGGYTADSVIVTGQLTEVIGATFASEADINITTPGGANFTANGATTTGYTGTIMVGPTVTSVTDFDPGAGMVSFEFFESFNDGAGADQTWDTVTIEFGSVAIVNGSSALGALPTDGTPVTALAQPKVAGGLDFITFEITGLGVVAGGYLNINTSDAGTGDIVDTEIFLFDSADQLVATDDDGQVTGSGAAYSMLTFGVDDPTPGDQAAGADGATLPAGTYTLVVGGFNTTVGADIASLSPGASEGDYDISFTYVEAVPVDLTSFTVE
ncbi:MAG: hypothetical protein AAF560_28715 [Acidobacteriota bacterium]